MRINIDRNWRVDASRSFRLPLSATTVWGQMRDYQRFLTLDPLHVLVRPCQSDDRGSETSATMIIEHRLFGIKINRLSRMLYWKEGRGFAISDLSPRGVGVGFPYTCIYEVHSTGENTSRLTVTARGRWTACWLPRPLVRLWMWWVLSSNSATIQQYMHRFARWRQRRKKSLTS